MDLFNFSRAVEQGIYDVMLWIFFYPYTLLRMLIWPRRMLIHVAGETIKPPETAFAAAMRPANFLMISIAIGTVVAPLSVGQIKLLTVSATGQMVATSWIALLLVRMIMFSLFPLAGAVLCKMQVGEPLTRDTLRIPFHQQSYIAAPFALIVSPTLVDLNRDGVFVLSLAGLMLVWFMVAQFIFFRLHGVGALRAVALSFAVLVIGYAGIVILSVFLF